MNKLFISFFFLFLGFILLSCDETTGPVSLLDDKPAITQISINPQNVQFNIQSDGFKDTTLAIGIYVSTVNIPGENPPQFVMTNKTSGDQVSNGSFDIFDSRTGNFGTEITLQTTTTTFDEYTINVFPSAEYESGNYAQTSFKIIGISNNPPLILETDNPDEITRPSSGDIPASFTAKVSDPDGQNTIDKVYIRIINVESGEVQGSPFEMLDDGSTYGDDVANDSTYTWSLPVTPNDNNPNRSFDIEYFAIDKGGLVSDTVTSTFSIRE